MTLAKMVRRWFLGRKIARLARANGIDLSVDCDVSLERRNPTYTTALASYTNSAMTCPVAQARYLAVWGVPWEPLGDGSCVAHTFAPATDAEIWGSLVSPAGATEVLA